MTQIASKKRQQGNNVHIVRSCYPIKGKRFGPFNKQRVSFTVSHYAVSYTHLYERTIFALQGMGYDVIIAHPERYRAIQQNTEIARNLLRMGCKLQASADFIAGGRMGREKRCV